MLIYNLVILLYGFVIRLASIQKLKARQWVSGRKNWRERYAEAAKKIKGEKIVWVHCASYGEFEQGRPLIDAIREKNPSVKIVLSFFSPSGYEAFKDWKGADLVCYLPLDTRSNASDFISIIQPTTVIFIKYEFWLNFLFELKRRNIPTYLVSAVFKTHHPFFKWYGGIFKRSLITFNKLFIQDESSGKLLRHIGIDNFEVCGDTRFDRVLQIRKHHKRPPLIEQFCKNGAILIGGSTWKQDNELLLELFQKMQYGDLKLILVPHEVDERSISELCETIKSRGLAFSRYSSGEISSNSKILVVDVIGLLSSIYAYGTMAYVGGGFTEGLHNTLEPAVFGIPVFFYAGDYSGFNEAVEMVELKAAFAVKDAGGMKNLLDSFLNDPSKRNEIKLKLDKYFESKSNATGKILAELSIG